MVNTFESCFVQILLGVLAIFIIGWYQYITLIETKITFFLLQSWYQIFFRDIDLMTQTSPPAARFAPNGSLFTIIVFLDFNSMYLWSQLQVQPLTPELRWVRRGSYFEKRVLTTGNSFRALQFIYYCQALLDETNPGVKIQHQYFQGEKTIYGHKVDGYYRIDGKEIVLEFNGKFLAPDSVPYYNQLVKGVSGMDVQNHLVLCLLNPNRIKRGRNSKNGIKKLSIYDRRESK